MTTRLWTPVDRLLDGVTMYRLVLYVLGAYVGIAVLLALFGFLPFSPLALLLSTGVLVLVSWVANEVLARIFEVPANVESAAITGLILALILDPAHTIDDVQYLVWAAVLAMASKYILAPGNKHIFNPAAMAAVIVAFALGRPASWWVGTGSMLLVVLVGGLLIVRKVRQEAMVASFLAAALVTVATVSVLLRLDIAKETRALLVAAPLFFFASIMLTEPLTTPPTRRWKLIYGVLVAVLFIPQIHIDRLYSTPELALVVGNAYSFLVGPKHNVALLLRRKSKLSREILDFVFTSSHKLAYLPGQYIEVTLAHAHPDSRGNRRYFTLASSPTEDFVRLGVRVSPHGSTFKRAMSVMAPRMQLFGGTVAGDFTLPADTSEKLVFVAGGIGITPFRSMLKYLVDTGQRRDIVVLYASKTADDIVYKDVLSEAETKLGASVIYTLTDSATPPRGWQGSIGRISERMIRDAVADYNQRTFYLSGPPDMVRAHERVLRAMGVGRSRIRKDFFPGLV